MNGRKETTNHSSDQLHPRKELFHSDPRKTAEKFSWASKEWKNASRQRKRDSQIISQASANDLASLAANYQKINEAKIISRYLLAFGTFFLNE